MKGFYATALTATLILASAQAFALSLTNRDPDTHSVQIVDGESEVKTVPIEVGTTLKGICTAGCIIALSNGAEMTFIGDEVVVIENGDFVVEE